MAQLVELCGSIKFYFVDGMTKLGFKYPFIITYNINIFYMMDFFRLLLIKIKNGLKKTKKNKNNLIFIGTRLI